jgi:hypothetical protein
MSWNWLIALCLAFVTAACESPLHPVASSTVSSPPAVPVDPTLRIPIGQSAQVTVGLSDPIQSPDPFGLEGWPDYRSRLVYVTAGESMTAILRVVSDTETDSRIASWRLLNWTCCSVTAQSVHQLKLAIPGPTILGIELIIPVNGPAETFTVSTSRVDP